MYKCYQQFFLDLHLWVFRTSNPKTFLKAALGYAHSILWTMVRARRNKRVCTGSLLKEKVLANTTWVAFACSTSLSSDRHMVFLSLCSTMQLAQNTPTVA